MRLAGPVLLAGRTAPSRVVFGPHETNLARRREISDRHVAHYARRAAGGAGVVVTEVASVHDSDRPYERAPLAVDAAPGWADVVTACRPHGTLVLAGLGHAGSQGSSAYGQRALWAPSRVADVGSREMPMELGQDGIDALVAGFAGAAALAVRAGVDGVEVDAGQYSLLRQFLSGLTNHRTDAYGRDRSRLLREVLAAVRGELGDDRVLALRLCGDELAPWAGITPGYAAAVAVEVAGWTDLLTVVRGSALTTHATRPDLHTAPGFNTGLCTDIRAALDGVAVVLQGSVVDPGAAQAALDGGVCDLVEMTRAQITDPDLVRHVRAGTPERIRPATLSNHRSAVRDVRNPLVSDDAEPDAGSCVRPYTSTPPRTGVREVVVVGGGPAGLEAARTAALDGARVRLFEASPRLGGALVLAAAVAGRSRLGVLVAWWERELHRLGVKVETGVRVTPAELDGLGRDGAAVLLATGSRDGARAYGSDGPVLSAAAFEAAVLAAGSADAVLPVGPVVVHDPVGDWTGVGIAEQVAAAGRPVALVTGDQVAGTQLSITGDLAPANARLDRAGVARELRSVLVGVSGGRAVLEHVWTGERREIPCALVIDCGFRLPDDELWRARPDLPRAGDCVAPRTLHEAVREGRRAVERLLRGGPLPGPDPASRASSGSARTPRLAHAQAPTRGVGGLFSPLRLGPLTVRNRIVFSAHLTNAAVDGLPTDQHTAYYAARAAGGAGLVITEEHSVHPHDRPYEKLIRGHDPAVVPGYRRLTAAVHAHGVPVLAQLNHNGGQASGMYSGEPVWAPSALADPMFREVAKEITTAEIREVVEGYALTAAHCVEGGFDGVELQCSHASLLRQFLSPLTNLRTDAYGGPLVNRARIVREVAAAVRDVLGPGRALGVRICGDEGLAGGTSVGEAVELARLLEADGHVDYLNTSIGVATATLHLIEASMHVPRGYAQHVPAALRAAVALPVVGVGRFGGAEQAERALAAGECDLVGVVRGQVADPDFAAKARSGAPLRTCSACNQECVGRVGLNRWLGCVQNPRAGREAVALPDPGRPRHVLVVGAGPAGLQAAATAAARGHRVTLCERDPVPGGRIRTAASAPGRGELLAIVDAPLAECRSLGVEIRTGADVDAAEVQRLRPDVVVLATGAAPALPAWAAGLDRVVDVGDVLDGTVTPSGDVLVYDELGFHQATSVAELLAARGCAVGIMTPGMVVGQDLGITLDMENFHRRARAITMSTDRVVVGARPGVVLDVLHHTTGAVTQVRHDWVVCAVPPVPDDTLWHALRECGVPVHRIGDCLAPRRAHAAILEGHRVGVEL